MQETTDALAKTVNDRWIRVDWWMCDAIGDAGSLAYMQENSLASTELERDHHLGRTSPHAESSRHACDSA